MKTCLFNTHNLQSVTDTTVLLLGELFIKACSPKLSPALIFATTLPPTSLFNSPECTMYQKFPELPCVNSVFPAFKAYKDIEMHISFFA